MELVCELYNVEEVERFALLHVKNVVAFVDFFSARSLQYIDSKELHSLKEACDTYGMHLFVDVKRMFMDHEMDALKTFLIILDEIKVDGIYYSDLSVYMMAKELHMETKLIYQPETLICNNYDAAMWKKTGVKAVCLAKELLMEELLEICQFNKDACEVFIHGHALMSFSKRPLLTNYFDEINFKEELKPYYYLREEQREDLIPVLQNEEGTHFFSSDSYMSFKEIKSLRDAHCLYGHMGRIFLSDDEYFEAIELYNKALAGEAVDEEAFANKYPLSCYDSGFYYRKTSVKKEY